MFGSGSIQKKRDVFLICCTAYSITEHWGRMVNFIRNLRIASFCSLFSTAKLDPHFCWVSS